VPFCFAATLAMSATVSPLSAQAANAANALSDSQVKTESRSTMTISQPKGSRPLNFAHRGGRRWAPENTLSAFRKSVELGVDGIELDIHKCTGRVKDMTWDELSKLDAGTWYDKKFAGEKLPLLKEVLDLVNGKLTINVEIKNCPTLYAGIEDDLLTMLDKYPYPDRIVISSFDHEVIHSIAAKSKKYKLALLGDSIIHDLPGYAKKVGAQCWNPDFDCVRPDSMKVAHDGGLEVNTWTVNKLEDWQHAKDLHVDTIITDDPEGLKNFLNQATRHLQP
jgi:glycerophosphoryl diester phosphodiesterase